MFEHFIQLMIFLNSLMLAAYDYSDRDDLTYANQILELLGKICTGIFIMELVFKVLAFGLVMHKRAYLRDWWNIIDLTVVISGYDAII